jgi:maleate isomerase
MRDEVLRLGVLTPHVATGPEAEFAAMAPGRVITHVARVSVETVRISRTGAPPPVAAARVLTEPPLLDDAAEDLALDVDAIGYASASTGYAIGCADEAAMVDRLARRSGVPVAATNVSAVHACHALGVARVAVVHPPWFDDDVNELGAAYFRGQGVDVVSVASVDLVSDPDGIEPAAVVDWAARWTPAEAEAVYFGGNGFRVTGAIGPLEDALGRPVLTSNQVLLWSLLAYAHADIAVTGFGRLFTRPHPPA